MVLILNGQGNENHSLVSPARVPFGYCKRVFFREGLFFAIFAIFRQSRKLPPAKIEI